MIRSFRLRLALYAALLAGLALVAFGLSAHWLIRDVKLDGIDRTLKSHVEREAGRVGNVGPNIATWMRVEANVAASLALRDARDLAMLIIDGEGETIYRSPQWPAALAVGALPWPQTGSSPLSANDVPALIRSAHAEGDQGSWQLAQYRPPPGERPPRPDERPPRPEPPPPFEGRRPPRPGENFPPNQDPYTRQPPQAPQQPGYWLPPATQQDRVQRPEPPQPVAQPAPEPTYRPPVEPRPETPVAPTPATENPSRPIRPATALVTRNAGGETWRIALAATPRARVATAFKLRSLDEEMHSIRSAFLFAMPVALFLVGLGAWLISGRALRPVQKLTDTTRRITAEGLDQRISASGEDHEFAELIELFNGMLERLGRSFQQSRRFSADAAHELKTPLAVLQGQLERAINTAEPGSPIQAELTSILDEVRRLTTISRKLLLLSQADAGRLAIHKENVDLSTTLADMLEDTQMLAPALRVDADIEPGLMISADAPLLRQVLHNLISNAIKYNLADGWVRIAAKRWPKQIDIVVSNASAGIPQEDRGKLFQRFYRADPARGSNVDGVGLGLALSREIARAHGGDLAFRIDHDNAVRFTLTLPATTENR